MIHRRLHAPTLAVLLLVSLPLAHALDRAGLAPAFEAHFPPSVNYLDCPYAHLARSCVLLPGATSPTAGYDAVRAYLRSFAATAKLRPTRSATGLAFQVGETDYQLRVAPSRARPGMMTATLSFAFDPAYSFHAVCLRRGALFDYASQASLTAADYNAMTTAMTCHGADPTDSRNWTPLVVAVQSRNLPAVLALLRAGADPNHITLEGWTPLLYAAKVGTRPILDALLQAGADPSYIAPDDATVATLEPFNSHLAATSAIGRRDTFAVLPAPMTPALLGEAAAGDPLAQAERPSSAIASSAPKTAPVAPSPTAPSGTAETATAPQDAGNGSGSAPTKQAADGSRSGATPARSRNGVPVMPFELLTVVALLALVLIRARRAEARPAQQHSPLEPLATNGVHQARIERERSPRARTGPAQAASAPALPARPAIAHPATGASTAAGPATRAAPAADLPAMPVPDPYHRDRANRQLDGAHPAIDPQL